MSDSDCAVLSNSSEASASLIAAMEALVSRYSRQFGAHIPSSSPPPQPAGPVVLIAGTTGSVGASFLSLLLEDETISKIYALNRKGSSGLSMTERHRVIFSKQNLEYNNILKGLECGRLVFLESDIGDATLQLSNNQLLEVCRFSCTI
jgi:hypothetical protein